MAAVLVKGYRPGKRDAIPPPLYLVSNTPAPYCHTCGRISRFHKTKSDATPTKFCSEACKRRRPKAPDRAIEDVLWHLLSGEAIAGQAKERRVDDTRIWPGKGESRVVVPTSLVEAVVFDVREEDLDGGTEGEGDGYDEEGLRVALRRLRGEETPQGEPERGGDVEEKAGGESEELKRRGGQARAARKERVKNACRRAVVFGLLPPGVEEVEQAEQETEEEWEDGPKRKGKKAKGRAAEVQGTSTPTRRRCEALVRGKVVEPSFAKGDWGVRWAED